MTVEDDAHRDLLLTKIQARRVSIAQFVADLRPRGNRLSNLGIIASAVGAVLIAGPALGGPDFANGVQAGLSLPKSSLVWQVLCLAALVVSVTAAVAANLVKRQDAVARISAAEACGAELEGLQTALEFDQVALPVAVKLYQEAITTIPFVPELPPERAGRVDPSRPSRALADAIADTGIARPSPGTP
jgi:hypothetical protein